MESLTFLVTTDFHASPKALEALARLLDQKTDYTAVLMLGDLINPRPSELGYAQDFIELITEQHQLPLFGLHGNNEPEEAYQLYREAGINIHLETKQLAGYTICGVGGFGYLNEPGFEDLSVDNLIINQQTIFITHVPPRQVAATANGPLVHLFGHRHSLAYSKQLGNTLQVQCPAGNLGKITELELPAKKISFRTIGN